MDEETKRLLENEIEKLFGFFDQDGNGSVDVDEISKSLRALGINKTIKECEQMILNAGGTIKEGIGRTQFKKMMLPTMQD
jgi:Ca2+-binding EF-hand superfamily protein